MILINKVTPFANESFQKDLMECLLKNSDVGFITNIIVFYNNTNIVLPKNNKVKLIVKNGYTDYEIIEYCKQIYKDDIFIFANPFTTFNNSLIHLEKLVRNVIKLEDAYIFNRETTLLKNDDIDSLFKDVKSNNLILTESKQIWSKEFKSFKSPSLSTIPKLSIQNQKKREEYLSKKEIKSDIPRIDIVIVSVDYNDILPITLKSIPKEFKVTIVTTKEDTECQSMCKELGVDFITSERIYDDSAFFNKGKAINDGIKSLKNPEWILLLDADIYLKDDFLEVIKNSELNKIDLFICKRLILNDYNTFLRWKNGQNVGVMERAKGYGFFHLFNAKRFGNKQIFPENYEDASFSDLEFRDSFKNKKEIDTYVLHLGPVNQNWKGRKTEKFFTKLPHILKNNISRYENLVKKNIRIVSNNEFNLINGGIYNPGLFYLNDKRYIITRCEKNFDSYSGVYDKYWGNLINPMYFQIDDDFNIIDVGVFKMNNFPILMRYEDFRIFEYKGSIISNHNIITPNNRYRGEDSWPNMNVCTRPGIFVSVALSEVNISNSTVTNKNIIKISDNNMEKNWSFFSKNDDLFFIYSLDPFIVYKKDNDDFIKIIDKKLEYDWNINTTGMKYCISTNLKRLNSDYYILLFHTKIDGYKYVQGCMLLNNDFIPTYMSKNPILESESMIGKYPNVLYAFSVDVKENEVHVYYGEADTNCCIAIIDKDELLNNLINSDNSHKINESI